MYNENVYKNVFSYLFIWYCFLIWPAITSFWISEVPSYISVILIIITSAAPIWAWEVKLLEIMTDRPTDRPTDGAIGKFHFQ